MNTQKVATKYRLSQWAQVIKAQLDSGQSIKDFCQTAGISKNSYFTGRRSYERQRAQKL